MVLYNFIKHQNLIKSERFDWIKARSNKSDWIIEPYGYGETRIKELKAYFKVNFLLLDALTDKTKLRAISNRLRVKIKNIEDEIITIKESEEYKTIIEIEDINIYFSGLKKKLEKELELLQQETISQK